MSNLGFSGAGGAGRTFTMQDLFSAVNTPASTSTTTATILNRYLASADPVAIYDLLSLVAEAPSVYDEGEWETGLWQ